MGFMLTEEQELIKQMAREFTQEHIAPVADEIDRSGRYPREIIQAMAEQDFLGLYLPSEYGGAEAGYVSYVLAVEEVSRVSGAVAAILIHHASLAAYCLNRWGSEKQKKDYLEPLCKGEKLATFALLEAGAAPGRGADKVVAVKQGDHYVLNGKKAYVASGGVADVYVVFALTDLADGKQELSAFIVDAATPGLSVSRSVEKMGLRGCLAAEICFANVEVAADHLLGAEGEGKMIATQAQAMANVAQGAMVVGIAQAAMEDAAQYAAQRIQFGRPIGKFPAIQTMLADMATHVYVARLAIYDAASLIDKGEPFEREAAMISRFAARIGPIALNDVIQIEGGYGYSEEMPASRFYRDIKGAILLNHSGDFSEKIIAEGLVG